MRKKFIFLLGCCLVAILCGCGHEQGNVDHGAAPALVEVQNYNFRGQETKLRFQKIPERVLVTRPEILDVLAALRVEERVVMASLPKAMEGELPSYQRLFPDTSFTLNELDKETAVMQRPDFIIGWRRSFSKSSLGSTEYWQSKGVPVYIEENSGPIPAVEPFPPGTVASEIDFIHNMGKIFQRETEAAREVHKIETALAQAQKLAARHQPQRVLSIAFIRNHIEVFGDKLLLGDIVNLLGSTNINYPYPFINGEQLLKTDPDVIFLVYHGGEQEAALALAHLQKEPYAKMRSVKNNKVTLINYKYLCASNVRTATTIATVYRGIYE